MMDTIRTTCVCIALSLLLRAGANAEEDKTLRVFIFAGQSNMVGSDSKVEDVKRFPPFAGLESAQTAVKFSYCIGRENKMTSDGWVDLQPVNNVVGPELSFARKVSQNIDAPIAVIKCAAGGTHLGGDWNPDRPEGFKMYPLALGLVRSSLAQLDRQKIAYRIEGFMWHQGENDMFNQEYMANYGENLAMPALKWYVSQQPPTDHERVNSIDVTTELEEIAAAERNLIHIKAFDLPKQEKKLVIDTAGIVRLGELIAENYLKQQ